MLIPIVQSDILLPETTGLFEPLMEIPFPVIVLFRIEADPDGEGPSLLILIPEEFKKLFLIIGDERSITRLVLFRMAFSIKHPEYVPSCQAPLIGVNWR